MIGWRNYSYIWRGCFLLWNGNLTRYLWFVVLKSYVRLQLKLIQNYLYMLIWCLLILIPVTERPINNGTTEFNINTGSCSISGWTNKINNSFSLFRQRAANFIEQMQNKTSKRFALMHTKQTQSIKNWNYETISITLKKSNHNDVTAQKWSFPVRISSLNVAKFAGNCGFGHINWRNP